MSGVIVDLSVLELWEAAYRGDTLKLQELLADPSIRDKINYPMPSQNNRTALFFACYGAANPETIRLLLSAGADPFQRDSTGLLPLHFAANTQQPGIIAALFEVPNMKSYRLDTALDTAPTPLHCIFLPSLGADAAVRTDKANAAGCLPYFLEVGHDPLGALQKRDNKGISTLMLVKHHGLKAAFHPYVPAKTFEILLKTIAVPGNIEDLSKPTVHTPSLEAAFDKENYNENSDISVESQKKRLRR